MALPVIFTSCKTRKNIIASFDLIWPVYEKAKKILIENRDKLEILAQKLIEKETLDGAEVRTLLLLPDLPSANATLV